MYGHGGGNDGEITVVIADEDALAREGLKSVLQANERFNIVAEAYDAGLLLIAVEEYLPDLVIFESTLLKTSSLQLISDLIEASPDSKIVLIGTTTSPKTIIRGLQMGMVGYIPKSTSQERFEEACLQVARGESPVLPDMAGDLLLYVLQLRTDFLGAREAMVLTKRQHEVLTYMVKGLCNKEIAAALHVSQTTVKSHVTAILRKLGVTDRTQAVVKAIRDRIVATVDPDDQIG